MTEDERSRFVTFWPRCINTHLAKDTGKIPYVMQRDFDFDSTLLTYRNDEYPNLEVETPGLDLQFIESDGLVSELLDRLFPQPDYGPLGNFDRKPSQLRETIDGVREMLRIDERIEFLHVQGLRYSATGTAIAHRVLNPGSARYLRLDMSSKAIDEYEDPDLSDLAPLKRLAFRLASFDAISVETEEIRSFLAEEHWLFKDHAENLYHLPTSVDVAHLEAKLGTYDEKENVILHVGRIGTHAKGSETILEAFAEVAPDYPDWKLVFVGTLTDEFEERYEQLRDEREDLCDQLEHTGYIQDRDKLYDQYRRAKLFAFPSRFEGYGQAMVEASLFGTVVLGSDIAPIREFTGDGERGYVRPVDDVDAFADALKRAMSDEEELRDKSEQTVDYVKENHDWREFCTTILESSQKKDIEPIGS
jgi:glycosyltransferase involved in cell wall biosynthesis